MVNRIGTLNLLLNTKLRKVVNISDHISILESYFSRLAIMDSEVVEPINVMILINTLYETTKYAAMTASTSTIPDEQATWDHVAMQLIQECERKSQDNNRLNLPVNEGTATLASTSTQRERYKLKYAEVPEANR